MTTFGTLLVWVLTPPPLHREAELIHARWAMLGTLGCVTPEFLAKYAGVEFSEPVWFKAGAQIFSEVVLTTLATPTWCTPSPFLPTWLARLC